MLITFALAPFVIWLLVRMTHRSSSDLGAVSERWLAERVRIAEHAP